VFVDSLGRVYSFITGMNQTRAVVVVGGLQIGLADEVCFGILYLLCHGWRMEFGACELF